MGWPPFILLVLLIATEINRHLANSLDSKDKSNLQENVNDYLIDERFPIVISNSFSNGDGDNESHFGASVTLLKYQRSEQIWLFIGEPKGNASTASDFKEPGVLWLCALNLNINSRRKSGATPAPMEYCEMIEIEDVTARSIPKVKTVGQSWLGGSISVINGQSTSTAPQLVTCSHRKSDENRVISMKGACYVLNVDQFHSIVAPRIVNRKPDTTQTQNYNAPYKIQVAFKIEPPHSVLISGFTYAAFGMSLNANQDQVFVGAPEFGAVSTLKTSQFQSTSPRNVSFIFGRNSKITSSDFRSNPYYGYAITSGNYYKAQYTHRSLTVKYLAGASPRSNNQKGRVWITQVSDNSLVQFIDGFHAGSYFGSVLYTQDIDGDGIDELFVGAPYTGQLEPEFLSQKVHPYIATGMVTNTMSSGNTIGQSSDHEGDGDLGCVYVYQDKSTVSWINELQVVQILTGGNEPFSRFGSAISSIQVSSAKKYVVVGAPYENGNEGAVYLYDAQELLKTRKYSKRISAGVFSLSKQFRGFGYSFSTNQEYGDVDGNGTPDLTIGSYLSKDVIVLRTRHQVKLTSQMIIIVEKGRQQLPSYYQLKKDDLAFELRVHVQWTVPPAIWSQRENLLVTLMRETLTVNKFWTSIRVDTGEVDKRYNVTVKPNVGNLIHQQVDEQTIEFPLFLLNVTKDQSNVARFSTSFQVNRVKDFMETDVNIPSLQMILKSWYNATRKLLPSQTAYKIINDVSSNSVRMQQQPTLQKIHETANQNGQERRDDFSPYLPSPVTTAEVPFSVNIIPNDCKTPKKCKPSLTISNIQFITSQGVLLPSKDGNFTIGTSPQILIKWTTTNTNQEQEVAILPGTLIQISLGDNNVSNANSNGDSDLPFLNLDGINKGCVRNGSTFRCTNPGYILARRNTTMEIRLQMTGFYPVKPVQNLKVQLTPTHAHDDVEGRAPGSPGASDSKTLTQELKLLADAKISVIGNRSPREISEENNAFQHTYKVSVTGMSPIRKITIQFGIPIKRKTDAENLVLVYSPEIIPQNSIEMNRNLEILPCDPTIPFAKPKIRKPITTETTKMDNVNDARCSKEKIGLKPDVSSKSAYASRRNNTGITLEFRKNETIELSCNASLPRNSQSTCMYFHLVLFNVPPDANFLVQFPMQLSDRAIALLTVEESSIDTLFVESVATAKILEGKNLDSHMSMDVAQVKVQFKIPTDDEDAPIWIYIVAVVGGVLVLIVTIVVMNKCGFFKRKTKTKLEVLKRQSQMYDMSTLIVPDDE